MPSTRGQSESPFVSHDKPQTLRTLGALLGQALQEVSVATSLCVSRPLGIAQAVASSIIVFVIKSESGRGQCIIMKYYYGFYHY